MKFSETRTQCQNLLCNSHDLWPKKWIFERTGYSAYLYTYIRFPFYFTDN